MIDKQHLATIVSHTEVAPQHFRLRLKAPQVAEQAQAGHFVHILPRAPMLQDPLLRRAFSVLSVRKADGTFEILYRVMGRGTESMHRWRAGESVDVLGPLGRPFAALAEYSVLVGGGVGVPPLAMLAASKERQNVVALLGARTAADLLCREDFTRLAVPVETATEDGSDGYHGLVTELLKKHLRRASAQKERFAVYSCGPLPMLRAVAALCSSANVSCQVSLEENMPCGVGICNGCVVPVTGAGDEYARYRRICIDGPVAWANEIDWSHWEESPCL